MTGKLRVKANGRDLGELSIKRPSYENTAREYKIIYRPTQPGEPPLTSSYFVYFYIGGEVLREHNRSPNTYANACALRVSFSLNMAGMRIPEAVSILPVTTIGGKRILQGGIEYIPDGDKYYYIYSVENLSSFLEYAWGKADKLIYVSKGVSQLELLREMNKKGVIIFYISGYSDATGHATIWDGEKCLDESSYYDPSTHPKQTLTAIKFWELK